MILKKTFHVCVAAAALLLATGAQAETVLRFGHPNVVGEMSSKLYDEFVARIAERTNGEVTIQVFPGEQLGKETEMVQQLRDGVLDMTAASMAATSTLVPAMEIPSAPFLWQNWLEAEAVISGAAMQPAFDELEEKHNIIPLTKIWYWGWRNFTLSDKPVRTPDDMAGLKIRVPESPVWVEMIRGIGAAPTPIPFSDVYTALQQGTVDGQENPIPTIYARKFYEVQGYIVMSRHMLQNNMILINKDSMARLDPRYQRIILEEVGAASAKMTLLQQRAEENMLKEIAATTEITIIDDPDRAAFAERSTEAVFTALAERW
ncbi:MAG: TRAP transporter substrate-binding protein, partial [Nitratireductor sp.]